jgi:hypothetical protein
MYVSEIRGRRTTHIRLARVNRKSQGLVDLSCSSNEGGLLLGAYVQQIVQRFVRVEVPS